jgi:superoxide dismutase, Fe-Mn family
MTRYTLPPLSYGYDALEPHISAEIMELHHDKHHQAYVDGANQAIEKLIESRSKGDLTYVAATEKQLAFNVSGHILHSIFWRNLSPSGGGLPRGRLALADPVSRRLGTTQIYDHQSNVTQAGVPLLVLDAWEHAYYLQYKTKKADYLAALTNLWDWEDVDRRLVRAQELDLALEDVAFVEVAPEIASPASP